MCPRHSSGINRRLETGKAVRYFHEQHSFAKWQARASKVYTYSVDGGDKVYEAQEVGRKAPHVEVNSSIGYWVSKDYLRVRDSDGRVHKLALVKTTRKP
jgi:hypothetical protein